MTPYWCFIVVYITSCIFWTQIKRCWLLSWREGEFNLTFLGQVLSQKSWLKFWDRAQNYAFNYSFQARIEHFPLSCSLHELILFYIIYILSYLSPKQPYFSFTDSVMRGRSFCWWCTKLIVILYCIRYKRHPCVIGTMIVLNLEFSDKIS